MDSKIDLFKTDYTKVDYIWLCQQSGLKIKGIKPHPSADGLNPLIGIDPRVARY